LGRFVGDAAYFVELGLLEAAYRTAFLNPFLSSDNALRTLNRFKADKAAYDNAVASRSNREDAVDRAQRDFDRE